MFAPNEKIFAQMRNLLPNYFFQTRLKQVFLLFHARRKSSFRRRVRDVSIRRQRRRRRRRRGRCFDPTDCPFTSSCRSRKTARAGSTKSCSMLKVLPLILSLVLIFQCISTYKIDLLELLATSYHYRAWCTKRSGIDLRTGLYTVDVIVDQSCRRNEATAATLKM